MSMRVAQLGGASRKMRRAASVEIKFLFPSSAEQKSSNYSLYSSTSESGTSCDFPGSLVSEDRKLDERGLREQLCCEHS